ncbi:MAG: Trm112 family protein [Gammaproteobacteria bacterium]|nr:Trm112 family protein [Gammaproteobacteria bacterium]
MDINLLEILACPICKGELIYDSTSQELICKFDRMAYPVVDGIPVMLVSRARRVGDDES